MTKSAPAAVAASRRIVTASMPTTGDAPAAMRQRRRELADDAEPEHRGRTAERQPGPNGRAQAVAGDAGQGGLVEAQRLRHLPHPAALVADGQQLGGGVVAGVADAVPFQAPGKSLPTFSTRPAAE